MKRTAKSPESPVPEPVAVRGGGVPPLLGKPFPDGGAQGFPLNLGGTAEFSFRPMFSDIGRIFSFRADEISVSGTICPQQACPGLACAGGFLQTGSIWGWADSVHALPPGIANSFRQIIPRMVCLHCLLTFSGNASRSSFTGPAPRPAIF